ncbi:MAG: DUF4126 domain-containing protein [Acidobacteriota bacterium]|nr:MAG: DUF4126 domain-containing protein [Acidobacteriota bacterium]
MDISHLALALGSSLTAGLNLYITVLTLGLLDYFDVLDLPSGMQILSHPWVMIAAGILFVIEFIADKVPYVDNTWDAIHSFIRIPAGAILAVGAMSDLPPHLIWVAALVGGFVTFSAHGAKASTRLAVNSTPEPFSNWILSFLEDAISIGLLWLVTNHPYIAVGASTVLLIFFLCVIYLFYRFLKMLFSRQTSVEPA